MSKICRNEEICANDRESCDTCIRNFKNKDIKDKFMYYKPVCKFGYNDCINDPAHSKRFTPEQYKKIYGEITPEEAMKNGACDGCKHGSWYDDECK